MNSKTKYLVQVLIVLLLLLPFCSKKSALEYKQEGIRSVKKNDYSTAAERFTQAIEAGLSDKKEQSIVLTERGNAYRRLYKFQNAVKDLTKATKLNPDAVRAYIFRGLTYKKLGKITG